ncbi:unnamed protein product, partial [Iphiclides podalirius]
MVAMCCPSELTRTLLPSARANQPVEIPKGGPASRERCAVCILLEYQTHYVRALPITFAHHREAVATAPAEERSTTDLPRRHRSEEGRYRDGVQPPHTPGATPRPSRSPDEEPHPEASTSGSSMRQHYGAESSGPGTDA